MSSTSVKKTGSEPNLIFMYLGAASMAFLGAFLGFIYLLSFPLKAYSDLAEREKALESRESSDPIPGESFYIEGPVLRSKSWEAKRKQLLDGATQTIQISPGEVNAWFASFFRTSSSAADEASSGLSLSPETLNVGISEEGAVYLNLPSQITGYGLDGKYVLSARARFEDGGSTRLKVESFHIGGAAVPLPGQLGAQFVSSVIDSFSEIEEFGRIRDAWEKVQSVEVSEGQFLITVKTS